MDKKRKKPGFFGVLLRVFAAILALLLLLLLGMWVIPMTETENRELVPDSADWMAKLPDEMPLSEIVLPGTHDSATKFVQLAFFSKCQSKDIAAQLEAGYRYLDIRLGIDGERLKLMHGFTDCKLGPMPWSAALDLEEVLRQCYSFLGAHPTETVVFAVKQEHGSESAAEFERALDAVIRQEPSFWLLTDQLPSLGEARGKLVLMRRYADEAGLGEEGGIPLYWASQKGNADTSLAAAIEEQENYSLLVQDRYEYGVEDKWSAFRGGLEQREREEAELAIHFLSTKGTAAYGHPWRYARALNPRLAGYELKPGCGWIIVDFASAPLAEHIWQSNFH